MLRSEGPRDYSDLIRSFKHPPTINVSDIPQRLAQLVNRIEPGFFNPNDGKPFPSSEENVQLANNKQLKKHFTWLTSTVISTDDGSHPVTGTNERYSMYDRFHEKNSNNPDDVLRRLAICPQLHANINSESHEQLHSVMNKDNYFLNMMNPATHVFMKRLLVHLRNEKKNKEEIRRQQQALQKHGLLGRMSVHFLGRITLIEHTGIPHRFMYFIINVTNEQLQILYFVIWYRLI